MPPPMPGQEEEDHDESDEDSSDSSDEGPAGECEDDRCGGPALPIWHCVDCDSSYCSDCWPRQGPHKPKKKGRDNIPHQKTNPFVVKRLKATLNPTRKASEIHKLHEDDSNTKWFGVSRDANGRPNLDDFGRYANLMSTISPIETMGSRYPQLVSFIGVTNAGKSTLIKLLVNHDRDNMNLDNQDIFPSPVVGSIANDSLPTSGDVHLYADPATHAEQLPILFADCEGFEGGERIPLGARARRGLRSESAKEEPLDPDLVRSRPIEWATTEESRQREYAVTALYPRLLYTFSDCVVFVLRNPKTFQSAVLTKLLEWGVAALEKSINQPALPHCVVAVNGTDPSVDEREWDISYATQSLLSSVKTALDPVEGVPRFRELAEYWRSLGKHIYSIEDLILRYYSTFKVIRIPSKPQYMTINEQVGKLHTMIKSNCEDSFRSKRRARMLTNADELNVYLQSGFDHFTTHLNIPFNFMQISLLRNPIPNDFGGHILQLCTTISNQQPSQHRRVSWLFEKLSVMLASCVLLDCARYRKGRVDQLFANYEKFFDYAMGEYLEMHYPCSFVSPDGRHCQVVKARHMAKGHQDDKGIIASGDYETSFEPGFATKWKQQLQGAIEAIHRDFTYELEEASHDENVQAIPEERIALDLHLEYINQFFEAVGPAAAICSHATCFCCLMDVPEHPLPCGHVLCTACIKAYGKQTKSTVSLSCCPLHREATNWVKSANIKFKPAGAGVRILSLDGGGIRGIVQLEVLRAIEQTLGGHLPVQAFFDLIVGTGTGGTIGAALAMKDRTVDASIDMFNALCDHAYTPRVKGVPIINQLAQVISGGPKFKTKPLYAALKTAFGEETEFFGPASQMRPGSRVALTTTSVTGRESMLLANYRRPEDPMPLYSLERPHEPDMELRTWESVAAALATPGYFRPFEHHSKTYLDGALRVSNPAYIAERERKLIWPDAPDPDLFLSLGTGQNRITVLNKLSDRPKETSSANYLPQPGQTINEARKASGKWRARRIDDVLDSEVAWADFRSSAVRDPAGTRRFIRFNPDLDREPPAGDSKSDIEALQMNVRKRLQTPHRLAALRNVAHRLVASSFYLDVQAKASAEKSEQVLSAAISCRFDDGSADVSALGKILADRRGQEFEPYFLIKPDVDGETQFEVVLTADVIHGMTDNAVFGLPNVYIPLRDQSKATSITLFLSEHDGLEPDGFAISGLPRVILGESAAGPSRRKPIRFSSEQRSLRSPVPTMTNMSLEGDNMSINSGVVPPSRAGSTSEESWRETQSKMAATNSEGRAKMSLAELIAQHQGQGTSIKGRTNRFWTYIGNNHMAQHPEMYSAEELAKHGFSMSGRPTESPTPHGSSTASYVSPTLTTTSTHSSATQEAIDPRDSIQSIVPDTTKETEQDEVARRIREQYEIAAAQNSLRPSSRHHPSLRQSIPDPVEPEHDAEEEGEDDGRHDGPEDDTETDGTHSHYSGQAVEVRVAQANPVVQLPPHYLTPGRSAEFFERQQQTPLQSAVEGALPDPK
ncbi:hypothetical protein D0863_03837 [Hortaea werneckii]|uniref:PNPLA domain-containing protein n=1 Tax=Hortaea werneckii TaxID=91943 RepID=A0A3M7EAT0_HORWE|nr:hypothetical protein D0863_03837 [Hortaea werneckii]